MFLLWNSYPFTIVILSLSDFSHSVNSAIWNEWQSPELLTLYIVQWLMFSISEYIVRGSTGRSWYKLPHTLTEKSANDKSFGISNTWTNFHEIGTNGFMETTEFEENCLLYFIQRISLFLVVNIQFLIPLFMSWANVLVILLSFLFLWTILYMISGPFVYTFLFLFKLVIFVKILVSEYALF